MSASAGDRPKPRHLGGEYAAQFCDEEVAAAYRHRPPYPAETFAIVEPLLGSRPRIVLELGAGTGDFTAGLAPLVDRLVAIEPSPAMLQRGRQRMGLSGAHVEWRPVSAEDHAFDHRYSAVVAAEAFHWLDWQRVMPRIAESLAPGGHLVLIQRAAEPPPWAADLSELIRAYSTNRDYVPYDVATELESRGLTAVHGRAQTGAVAHKQAVDDYIESFHSRNGFSRARLAAGRAREFDDRVRTLVGRYCPDGTVSLRVLARVVWGRPLTGPHASAGGGRVTQCTWRE